MMDDNDIKRELVEVRSGILQLMAEEEDFSARLKEAYEHLPKDAWVNQVAQNVVKSEGYDRMEPVEAASWLALTVEVADLIKERLNRRFEMIVCASTAVFPYIDSEGQQQAVTTSHHTINVPQHSSEAIADTLAAFIRLTAKDDDDTLFIYKLVVPQKHGMFIAGAEAAAQHPRYTTNFATVRRKVS